MVAFVDSFQSNMKEEHQLGTAVDTVLLEGKLLGWVGTEADQ